VKQPKVLSAPSELPPPPLAPQGPRYRYSQVPPEKVALRIGDLIPQVPQTSWVLGSDADQVVEFPAAEILGGPVPKISLNRLVELAPKAFRLPAETEKIEIRLPIARLASAYRLVSERIVVEEPWVGYSAPVSDVAPVSEESPAPLATSISAKEESELEKFAPPVVQEKTVPQEKPEAKKEPEPAKEPEAKKETEAKKEPITVAPPPEKSEIPPEATPDKPSDIIPPPPLPPQDSPEKTQGASSRRIFSVLPMFRRKGAEAPPDLPPAMPAPPPAVEEPVRRPRVELPPLKNVPPPASVAESHSESIPQPLRSAPRPPLGAIAAPRYGPPPETVPEKEPVPVSTPPVPAPVEAAQEVPKPEVPAPEQPPLASISQPSSAQPPTPSSPPPPPAVPPASTVVLETGAMSVVAPEQETGGLANQDDLQAIFLTEETLTPERIIELCGGFPGINSCVLTRGGGVIASHNVPDSIDPVSLSAHALEMIRAMRESSAKMGVGAIPAVTIHSEKGPITFFHEDDLCFLVLHKDRGFVPGVREKLQQVVHHLAQARLPKPVSQPSRLLEG